jgi:predicted dehydrogenase
VKEVRIGVIGCGGIAQAAHLPNYVQIEGVKIVAVADVLEKSARETAKKYDAEAWYTDYRKLLDREDIDGVSVTTPPKWHAEISIYAAKTGKHILVEKPLCRNVDEADEMIKAARKADVILLAGHQDRFDKRNIKIKQLISEGAIGKPYAISSISGDWHMVGSGWFYNKDIAGGGVGMDHLIYTVYMWQYWMGKIESVYALVDTFAKERPIYEWNPKNYDEYKITKMIDVSTEDSLGILMRFKSGAVGTIYRSWVSPINHGYADICGSNGVIILHGKGYEGLNVYVKESMSGLKKGWNSVKINQQENVYLQKVKHFVDCIRKDARPIITDEEGRDAVEVIQASYLSGKKKSPIYLPIQRKGDA